MTRLVAVQRCPVDMKAPCMVRETALDRSASANTTRGFFPPISSWVLIKRGAVFSMTDLPTPQDPVKETAFTMEFVIISSPTREPGPVTKLITPLGTPASTRISTSLRAVMGACEAGFKITVFPQARARAVFQAGMAIGKFQGVIMETTPRGILSVYRKRFFHSEGVVSPQSR